MHAEVSLLGILIKCPRELWDPVEPHVVGDHSREFKVIAGAFLILLHFQITGRVYLNTESWILPAVNSAQ